MSTVSFFNNNPKVMKYPSLRRNIHCRELKETEGLRVEGQYKAGSEYDSLWIYPSEDCMLQGKPALIPSYFFIPRCDRIELDECNDTHYSLLFLGMSIIPCNYSLPFLFSNETSSSPTAATTPTTAPTKFHMNEEECVAGVEVEKSLIDTTSYTQLFVDISLPSVKKKKMMRKKRIMKKRGNMNKNKRKREKEMKKKKKNKKNKRRSVYGMIDKYIFLVMKLR
jgi:hypothetical protein